VFVGRVAYRFRASSSDADYWIRIGAVTGILSIAFREAMDFSLQMPGNAALFVIPLVLPSRRSSANATR
jgi:hypothetical protein